MSIKHLVLLLLITVSSLLPINTYAEQRYGIIDRIDHQQSLLIINDSAVKMALNLKVLNSRGESVTRHDLKLGAKVVYQASYLKPGLRQASIIWIKTQDYVYPQDED